MGMLPAPLWISFSWFFKNHKAVLRIRDISVPTNPDPRAVPLTNGSGSGSGWILLEALKNMGLGSGTRKKPIPDHGYGSRGHKGTGSRIRIRNTEDTNKKSIFLHITSTFWRYIYIILHR